MTSRSIWFPDPLFRRVKAFQELQNSNLNACVRLLVDRGLSTQIVVPHESMKVAERYSETRGIPLSVAIQDLILKGAMREFWHSGYEKSIRQKTSKIKELESLLK